MRTHWFLASFTIALTGCTNRPHVDPRLSITETRTDPTIGAGQGAAIVGDLLALYGDADTGIVNLYTLDALPPAKPLHTIALTKEGGDLAPHPTGLAHHPELGTYIRSTVRQIGTIFHIDLEAAINGGTLDRAVKRIIDDDLAINGTRPEFVRYQGEWFIATADYGDAGNALSL